MIDIRSDTVTMPTPGMREAIADAEVGDDVYGDDPSVVELERRAAEVTGKEAAAFVTSGTQGNLSAILAHTQRGDEVVMGVMAHTNRYEGGGASVLGGVHLRTVPNSADGTLDLDLVVAALRANDSRYHYARTSLLTLENTRNGMALPMDYLAEAADLAAEHDLSLHLDGARLFNAAVFHGVAAEAIARHFDSVTFCLSKGLGAPVGSVLCGSADFIERARRWRKVLGGAMRQAGVIAAAGIYALDHNVDRLADDHANAAALAAGLAEIEGVDVDFAETQTNMVFVTLPGAGPQAAAAHLADRGIKVSAGDPMRMVMHLGVSRADVATILEAVESYVTG